MSKIYKYKDLLFCDDDISEKYDNYGGDLFDLYLELESDNKCTETTYYYLSEDPECAYESAEDLIEEEFGEYLWEEQADE